MNRRIKSFVAVFPLALPFFLIAACASTLVGHTSLPPPSESAKSILVISLETEKKYPQAAFGKYKLTLKDGKGTIMLHYGVDHIIVSGLEPGDYEAEKLNFIYKSMGAHGSERAVAVPFRLKPGFITVLRKEFKFILYRKSGRTWQTVRQIRLYPKDMRDILTNLSKDKNFHLWKNDYEIK